MNCTGFTSEHALHGDLTTGIRDLARNPLESDYEWSFTTGVDPTTQFTVEVSNVSIDGQGTSGSVLAGADFSLELDYTLWNSTGCPASIAQIVIGIEADGQTCAYDGIPGVYPGESGPGSVTLTAPFEPGTYSIRYKSDLQFGCADAVANYDANPPSGNVIATLTVEPIFDTAYYYRLTNQFLGEEKSLEGGDGAGGPALMTPTGPFTGQFWKLTQLHPIK